MLRRSYLICIISIFLTVYNHRSDAMNSVVKFSTSGMEYKPIDPIQLISINTGISKSLYCSALCNKNLACRTVDYDPISGQCRLFNGDLTTGLIIPSNSSTSIVGSIYIDASRYTSNSQQCSACNENRYEVCDTLSETCECPPTTYWDGSMCRCKLFENQSCSQADACREDLNLTCLPTTSCNGLFTQCKIMANYPATTIAGNCNGTSGNGNQAFNGPIDVALNSNGTLFVADWVNNRVQAFASGSRIGITVTNSIGPPQGLFIDSMSNLYVASGMLAAGNRVMMYPSGVSIPSPTSSSCTWANSLNDAYGIAVDRAGNMYVSSSACSFITRWNVNHTDATMLIANSSLVYQPRHLYLDEDNSLLYAADKLHHRILKISLNGSFTPQTVAGTPGVSGNAANKLNNPTGVYVSRIDGAIYVADTYNNRIQKWTVGASIGITVGGNSNGSAGNSMYALNNPYAVILDRGETFLYVADYNNNRVQRFLLR